MTGEPGGVVTQSALLDATLRTNPDYRLVALADISQAERVALAGLSDDPDLCAVLMPGRAGLTVKAICRRTADIIEALDSAGKVPRSDHVDSELRRVVARLVIDSVLMIQTEHGWLTGTGATEFLGQNRTGADQPTGEPARLSIRALNYAAALDAKKPTELSAALYFFNRLPASPVWRRRVPSSAAARRYLGLDQGPLHRSIHGAWHEASPSQGNSGWFYFVADKRPHRAARQKLYISPNPDVLPHAVGIAVATFVRHRVPSFKIGSDLHGILRPDKFVAYFDSTTQAKDVIAELRHTLAGCAAQAVPFTHAVDPDGLLCRGVDPPRSERVMPWQGFSWRRWITDRLASSLFHSREERESVRDRVRFALDRLELEGVNTSTWTPNDAMWDTRSGQG